MPKNPELKAKLNLPKQSGRPRIEKSQPVLMKSFVDVALYGSTAHEKRELELYIGISRHLMSSQHNYSKTVQNQSQWRLSLLQKRCNTLEEKLRVATVSEKLIRSKIDHRVNPAKKILKFY